MERQEKKNELHWYEWTYNVIAAWIEIIIHSLLCIIIIILIYYYFKKFYTKQNKKNIKKHDKLFRILLWISLILSFINIYSSYIITTIGVLVFNFRPNKGCFYQIIIQMITIIQRNVLYIFWIFRLKFTFEDTIYKISAIKFNIMLSCSSGTGILYVIYLVTVSSFIETFRCDGTMFMYFIYGFIVGGIWDIFWQCLLLYMFVIRLRGIMKNGIKDGYKLASIARRLIVLSLVNYSIYVSIYVNDYVL